MIFDILQQPVYLLTFTAFLGLVVGSFLNVVIHRLPKMLDTQWRAQCQAFLNNEMAASSLPSSSPYNLALPHSHCPKCQHRLRWRDNIPLLSYLWLKGKCAHCGTRISIRYPLIELACALLSVMVVWQFGFTPQAAGALVLTWSLLCLAAIDIEHQLLPDAITLPLLWLGLLVNSFGLFCFTPVMAIVGACAGYLSLWLINWLFKLIRHKEGLGHGDFKLLAMLGAWLSWPALIPILLISSVLGILIAGSLLLLRRQGYDTPFAFGPYLAIAGLIVLLSTPKIIYFFETLCSV